MADPSEQGKKGNNTLAIIASVLGALGLAGLLLLPLPIIGYVLGVASAIVGWRGRQQHKSTLATIGLALGVLSILGGLILQVYIVINADSFGLV
jgi:hypothetical protein